MPPRRLNRRRWPPGPCERDAGCADARSTLHPCRASPSPFQRFQSPWMGHSEGMKKLLRRSAILTATLAPIAALSLVTPAAGFAQPLDCQNGYWWDPVANVCQPPAPLGCQNGDWWDPVANVCRPPIAPVPLNCGGGQYWNPVSNACRPFGQV